VVQILSTAPRGISSAGRASALHVEGHRFEPDILHHMNLLDTDYGTGKLTGDY
jgi:hypothetical protein